MTLQLKTDYQQGIALRASAHLIGNKLKKAVADIETLVDTAKTGTAARITKVQMRKFTDQANEFIKIANDPKSKDMDNLTLQLKLEKAFLDTQNSNIKQRQLLHNEMTNHPGTVDLYQPLMDTLTILARINISDITSINFDKKSAKLAQDLLSVSTINQYSDLVRDHDVSNDAIVAKLTQPMTGQFKMYINTQKRDVKAELAQLTEDQFAEKIKEPMKVIYGNRFAGEVASLAINRAREIFDVESDPTEFKQLENHLKKLAVKTIDSRYVLNPLVKAVTENVYQPFVDAFKEAQ